MMALLTVGMGLTSCDGWVDNSDNPLPVIPEGSSESGEGSSEVGDKGEVTAITVDLSKIDEKYLDADKTKLQLTVGDELTLSFTILPAELADTKVELTSADATVLSIDGLKVKALKEGETKVTAKAGEKTAECTVVVKAAEVAVTGVTLDKTALAMTIGDADVQLNVTVTPADATNADVDWESSDLSVATVDGAGIVHAVADGTATITAKAGGKSATCTVTVSKKAGSISYTTTEISKSVGDDAFTNELTKVGDGTVSYASDNTAVATVATDGKVTIKGAGTATITATVADSDTYTYATTTASYKLTVSQAVDKLDPFGNGGDPLN